MPAGIVVNSGSLVSPGGQQGIPGPNAVSADAGNQATFGSDSRIYVPDPTPLITGIRLRSYNALGNPSMEVAQPVIAAANNISVAGRIVDRWFGIQSAGLTASVLRGQANQKAVAPGTDHVITRNALTLNVNATQATLAAGDYLCVEQYVEGPAYRPISGGVTSISMLAYATGAFCVYLQDAGRANSYVSSPVAAVGNSPVLITFPNIPLWPSSMANAIGPGAGGYIFGICLGAGSTYSTATPNQWSTGDLRCTSGFNAMAATALYGFNFIQHEPGPVCSTFIDKPFDQNLDECLRYFQKTCAYANKPGLVDANGQILFLMTQVNSTAVYCYVPFPKPMAKTATVVPYSPVTGASNVIRDASIGADRGVTSITTPGDKGYSGVNITGQAATGNPLYAWHHTADTGW